MNQQGSVSYLILMPSLVTIVAIAAAVTSLIFAFRNDQKSCRGISLDAQTIQGEALNKILKLNMKAKMLRQKEIAIRATIIAAAATPGAQTTLDKLYVILKLVQSSRKALDVQQRSIIHIANTKATQIANSSKKLPHKLVRLRIHAVNKNEIAPEYEVDFNFEKAQSINYNYKISMKDILPGWLFNFFINVKDLKTGCGSTLKKKEDKWIPTLNAVN